MPHPPIQPFLEFPFLGNSLALLRNSTAMSNWLIVSPCANPFWRRVSSSKACSPVQASARSCADVKDDSNTVSRRALVIGLAGVVGLVSVQVGGNNTMAASRRPPPPPPEEKRDPNISGVRAKVLASKKRKEAMKEAVAKLRDEGKSVE